MLTPLNALGLEPTDLPPSSMSPGGSGRHPRHSSDVTFHQASLGLGLGLGKPPSGFSTPSKLSSNEPFDLSISGREASVNSIGLPSPMQETVNQSGVPVSRGTTSRHEEERNDSNQVEKKVHPNHGQSNMRLSVSLEPVAPLQATANRWHSSAVDPASPEIVSRKVKGLLNKLTMKKFDSISDEIIAL